MRRKPVIAVDTREQKPFDFGSHPTRPMKLAVGDYSLVGHSRSGVVVERKSFDDFFGTFTRRRAAILKQLAKMGRFEAAALVVEVPMERVVEGHPRTRVDGYRLLQTAVYACARHGVAPLFCRDRHEAARTCHLFLMAYHRAAGGGPKAASDKDFDAREKRVYRSRPRL